MNNMKSAHSAHRSVRNGQLTFFVDLLSEAACIINKSIMIMPVATLFCLVVLLCIPPLHTISDFISHWHSMPVNDKVAAIRTLLQYAIFSSLLGVLANRLLTAIFRL